MVTLPVGIEAPLIPRNGDIMRIHRRPTATKLKILRRRFARIGLTEKDKVNSGLPEFIKA
jgi:hypothetical protein